MSWCDGWWRTPRSTAEAVRANPGERAAGVRRCAPQCARRRGCARSRWIAAAAPSRVGAALAISRVPRGGRRRRRHPAFLLLAALGYGVVSGGHVPAIVEPLKDTRRRRRQRGRLSHRRGLAHRPASRSAAKRYSRPPASTGRIVAACSSTPTRARAQAERRSRGSPKRRCSSSIPIGCRSVTEREAFALWQKDGKVSVIAADGTVLEPYVEHALHRPAARGRQRAQRRRAGFPRAARPLSAKSATSCAPRSWWLSGAGTCGSRTASTCGCRRPTSSSALDDAGRARPREEDPVPRHRVGRSAAADRVTVRLSEAAAQARDEALKREQKKKGGDA